jgi:hypothetical protein
MDAQSRSRVSRRIMARGLAVGGLALAAPVIVPIRRGAAAEAATPPAGSCVTAAPPLDASGIAAIPLLVGGIVREMPAGPVEVRITRLAMAPGTVIDAAAVPYPVLMYIETGTTACPGGPGRVGYRADGSVLEVTRGTGIQFTPAGATQYIPANVPDGAGNQGSNLMSSLVIEFVPVAGRGTPASGS